MSQKIKPIWSTAASLLVVTIMAAVLFIGTGVFLAHAKEPASEARPGIRFASVTPPLHNPQQKLTGVAREKKIKALVASINALIPPTHRGSDDFNALIPPTHRGSDDFKRRIAEAALHAQETTGVDATFMIALARQETDFRNLVLINTGCTLGRQQRGCNADCGMTQHHVTGSRAYVHAQCNKLKRDMKYSFQKSAEEIAHHIQWCTKMKHKSWVHPLRRCVLNRYNQGPFYRTVYRCKRKWQCESSNPERNPLSRATCLRKRSKCFRRAAYWKSLTCFEYGARSGVREKRSCRRCFNITKIQTKFYPPLPSGPTQQAAKTSDDSLASK